MMSVGRSEPLSHCLTALQGWLQHSSGLASAGPGSRTAERGIGQAPVTPRPPNSACRCPAATGGRAICSEQPVNCTSFLICSAASFSSSNHRAGGLMLSGACVCMQWGGPGLARQRIGQCVQFTRRRCWSVGVNCINRRQLRDVCFSSLYINQRPPHAPQLLRTA